MLKALKNNILLPMKRFISILIIASFFSFNQAFAQFERGYADLVDQLLPSVVSIATSQVVERNTSSLPELPEGHPFNDMFEDFFGNQMPKRENLTGLGSGFIISKEGYVVTNNHVISGADQITVIFNNGVDIIISKVGQDSVARKINSFTLDAAVGVGVTIIPFLNPQQNGLDSGQRLVVGSNNIPILSIGSTTLTLTSGLVSGISTTDTVESYSDHYNTISLGSTVQAAITSGDSIVIKKKEDEYYRQERPVMKQSIELSSNTVSAGSTFSFTINAWNLVRPQWYAYSIGYDNDLGNKLATIITSPVTGIISATPTSTGRNHATVTTVVSVASTITEDFPGTVLNIHAWHDSKEHDPTIPHLETKIGITTI